MGSGQCNQFLRVASDYKWVRGWSVCAVWPVLFHVHPPADPLRWLEKAIPAVSLSESDLRSLCSKITAPSSATVLMHMKQNGRMVWTGRAHGCTCNHACAGGKRQWSHGSYIRPRWKLHRPLLHVSVWRASCRQLDFQHKGWFMSTKCSNVKKMMWLRALLPFLSVCRSLLFQGDQAYSSHF